MRSLLFIVSMCRAAPHSKHYFLNDKLLVNATSAYYIPIQYIYYCDCILFTLSLYLYIQFLSTPSI